MSAAIKTGYIYKPTLAFSLSGPAFSLNCVILFSQPILATQLNNQDPSECAGTDDWLKIILFFGLIPQAKKAEVVFRMFCFNSLGSCLTVTACKSTTQKIHLLFSF